MSLAGKAGAAALAAALGLGAACVDGGPTDLGPLFPPEAQVSPAGGAGSAARAARLLCEAPGLEDPIVAPERGPTPPAIAEVRRQVQQVRGLQFRDPVPLQSVTPERMSRVIVDSFDETFPRERYERRTVAWQTIGVIPRSTTIEEAERAFLAGQVAGFYVPHTGELVYVGTERPDAITRITLAHEFTHALDDQHFDLGRLDRLFRSCEDERAAAAVGAVEGSAQYFASRYFAVFGSLTDLGSLAGEAPSTAGIPPFILRLELWPYEAGMAYISALEARGGIREVDGALTRLPVSTEQVIHPLRYPNDLPTPLDIGDIGSDLGGRWKDLDVMEVGEAWLAIMLGLRLDAGRAEAASAGWDGALYRAWTDGRHTAVVLRSTWDTISDAAEFRSALADWVEEAGDPASVSPRAGRGVTAVFASDPGTLADVDPAAS